MMNIEWNKVVTQAITTLVVAVFLGAATIVWKGATSVDDKVQATRQDMQFLITALSDKMARYELQITSLSNQLEVVINNQKLVIPYKPNMGALPPTMMGNPIVILEDTMAEPATKTIVPRSIQERAKAYSIEQQLKR